MECSYAPLDPSVAFLNGLRRKAVLGRVPVSGSVELTRRCNLRCVHCYARPSSGAERREMDTRQLLEVLDRAIDHGCLHMIVTGGEPLVRPDFAQIYRHVKNRGVLVTVFTNGTLITDQILSLFEEYPPTSVEISLYGATEETYEGITGVAGSHRACLAGIRRLVDHNVPVALKTMLMRPNRHEFPAIREMAQDLGVRFRHDPVVVPRLDGDRSPLELRVPPEEAVEHDFAGEKRRQEWRRVYDQAKNGTRGDRLFQCGAGVTNFHINAAGGLQPCIMVNFVAYDLFAETFSEGWRRIGERVADPKSLLPKACRACTAWQLCFNCPGYGWAETGCENEISQYQCTLGRLRVEYLNGR